MAPIFKSNLTGSAWKSPKVTSNNYFYFCNKFSNFACSEELKWLQFSRITFGRSAFNSRRVGGGGGCSFSAWRRTPSLLSERRVPGSAPPGFRSTWRWQAPARPRRGCGAALPLAVPRRGCCAADALVPRRTFPGFWCVRGDSRSLARRAGTARRRRRR